MPGQLRTHSVGVLRYRGAPAADLEYLVERMCKWLNDFRIDDDELTFTAAILRAALAHLYVAWIHPFGDGNGRTARLVEFQILIQSGVPLPAVAHRVAPWTQRRRALQRVDSVLVATLSRSHQIPDFWGAFNVAD